MSRIAQGAFCGKFGGVCMHHGGVVCGKSPEICSLKSCHGSFWSIEILSRIMRVYTMVIIDALKYLECDFVHQSSIFESVPDTV